MKYIKSYIQEEDAMDELVSKMLLIVGGICVAIAIGWYVWNTLQNQTEKQKCNGTANPFCVE